MADRLRQGIYSQLIGHLLLLTTVICISLLVNIGDSGTGCLLVMTIIALILTGGLFILVGFVLMIIGGDRTTRWLALISVLIMVISPFFFVYAASLLFPLSAFGIVVFIFVFLTSLVIPYFKLGSWISGAIASFFALASSLFVASSVLFSTVSMNVSYGIVLFLLFFLMLLVSCGLSLRRLGRGARKDDYYEEKARERIKTPVSMEKAPRSAPPLEMMSTDPSIPSGKTSSPISMVKERSYTPRKPPPGTEEREEVKRGKPRAGYFRAPAVEEILKEFDLIGGDVKIKREVEGDEPEEVPEEELGITSPIISGETLYDILRIPNYSDRSAVRKAYRKRAMMYHPDLNPRVGSEYARMMEEEMRKINMAKEILKYPERKRTYDRMLKKRLGD